jgi:hypothetical protein
MQIIKECIEAPYDLMLRLYFLIKAKPEIVNHKYPMFNGTERSFADLLHHREFKVSEEFAKLIFDQVDPNFLNSPEKKDLMSEVFHKIRINNFSLEFEGDDGNAGDVGKAIAIQQSALNHSCRPNSLSYYHQNRLEVRAKRDIAAGEEVTISYIDVTLRRKKRQKQLLRMWDFICRCDRCEAGDTPEELEAMEKLKEVAEYMTSLNQEDRCAVILDKMMETLPFRERLLGQFHPVLTNKMLAAAHNRFLSPKPFSAEDEENMLMLVEKLMKAWPITHGSDHEHYPIVMQVCEEVVRRKFVKK